ncbi:MAG: PQQ-dependent sugar dehydrogenase [Phycisphaerales bacterium]
MTFSRDRGMRERTGLPRGVPAAAAGVLAWAGVAVAQPTMPDPRLVAEVVATGLGDSQLTCSTGFFFPARDTILAVSRADGRVRRVDLQPETIAMPGATVLDLDIVFGTLNDQTEYGVQALEPHPSFASTGWVYARYDQTKFPGRDTDQIEFHNFNDPAANVIERYVWDPQANDGDGALVFDTLIRSMLTYTHFHHGGPIAFDHASPPHLFTLHGDQRHGNLISNNVLNGFVIGDAGTIIRINDDGSIPEDNPFGVVNGAPAGTEAWFAYGTRNSFGLTIDPVTGDLWQTDNGEFLYDEVNRVSMSDNLGWLRIMGPTDHFRQTGSIDQIVNLPGDPPAAYHDPQFAWFQATGATAIHFLYGSALGAPWDDAVIVANYNTGFVWILRLNETRTGFVFQHPGLQDRVDDRSSFLSNPVGTEAAELLWGRSFAPNFRGVLAIERGPDGLPYFLNAAGQIIRVRRACPQDFNGDGFLDPDDLGDYINCFFGNMGDPGACGLADFNKDGSVDPDDLGDFIDQYFAGC